MPVDVLNSNGGSPVRELLFVVRPSAIVSPRSLVVHQGETAEFSCEVTGSPEPRVEWIKDGGSLPESHSIQAGVLR